MELSVSLKEVTCRVLTCDECGEEYENGEGYTPHFRDGETAVDWDDEWYLGPGKDYCDICREKVEHDHMWDGGYCAICREEEPEEDESE